MTYSARISLQCPQRDRQNDSNNCTSLRAADTYEPVPFSGISARKFRIIPPTPIFRHRLCPNICRCKRAHAIRAGRNPSTSSIVRPIVIVLGRGMVRTRINCARRRATNNLLAFGAHGFAVARSPNGTGRCA